MSRRARTRAAAVAAKYIALVPLEDEPDDDCNADEPCPCCDGDGADPMSDYSLLCPVCCGDGQP